LAPSHPIATIVVAVSIVPPFLALLCTLFLYPAAAEETAITNQKDLNCQTTYPPAGSITNLSTGLGIARFSFDPTTDQVPPCSGDIPTTTPNTSEYPLNVALPQLAKVRSTVEQCSGTLIAQNAVITAGHCVYDLQTKTFYRGITVTPGYQNGPPVPPSIPLQTYPGVSVMTFEGYTANGIAAHDIAVIIFDGSVSPLYMSYGLSAYNVANCGKNLPKLYSEPHYSPSINHNEAQAGADGTMGVFRA
jgi:hypothetical protein